MPKTRRGADAAINVDEPTLVTAWGDFIVEGGVLYVSFRSGAAERVIAMGPAMAFEAIDRARKALQRGVVERLLGSEPAH